MSKKKVLIVDKIIDSCCDETLMLDDDILKDILTSCEHVTSEAVEEIISKFKELAE